MPIFLSCIFSHTHTNRQSLHIIKPHVIFQEDQQIGFRNLKIRDKSTQWDSDISELHSCVVMCTENGHIHCCRDINIVKSSVSDIGFGGYFVIIAEFLAIK